jgi:hypothetical protein
MGVILNEHPPVEGRAIAALPTCIARKGDHHIQNICGI